MKNYILVESGDFCRYYAKNKQDLIDFVRYYYKNSREYWSIDSLQNVEVLSITYNAKKIDIDNFFGDVLATEKSTGEGIDYDLYAKYGITQKNEKKDFLYLN
jgi:hypothetical protein